MKNGRWKWLILGLAGCVLCGPALIVQLGEWVVGRQLSEVVACQQHAQRLSDALLGYADDHGFALPGASTWQEAVIGAPAGAGGAISPQDFSCAGGDAPLGLAMPANLGGRRLIDIDHPGKAVLLIEVEAKYGGRVETSAAVPANAHGGRVAVLYADGHTSNMSAVVARAELERTLRLSLPAPPTGERGRDGKPTG